MRLANAKIGVGEIHPPMISSDMMEQYLWWLTILGHAALLVRLWALGLHRIYRCFASFLLFSVVRSLFLLGLPWAVQLVEGRPNLPFATKSYSYVWVATEPLLWVFYVLVVLELYSLILQNYKGIASLGRWVLLAGLVTAVVISVMTLSADLSGAPDRSPLLRHLLVIDRGVVSSLVIFLLFISCFLAWYPVPLNRNVVVHCIVYAGYFLSMALVVLLRNVVGSGVTQTVNIVASCVTLACLLVWIRFLNLKGETVKVRMRPHWAADQEQVLVDHLSAINSTLLRASRK
jgi:hypothetical protein